MNCPIDGAALVITTREGIEIDYCPKCRGIWLDRGELDKLIERASVHEAQRGGNTTMPISDDKRKREYVEDHNHRFDQDDHYDRSQYRGRDDDDDDRRYGDNDRQRRKKSFLGEIFDIFD